MQGYGHQPIFVEGHEPEAMHERMAAALDEALDAIAAGGRPMIVLRTPKGWTGPKEVDGQPTEGTWRSHQVPLAQTRENPEHLAQLETWLRSYRPEELFDEHGAPRDDVLAPVPEGERRMGANPHANGGVLLQDLRLPDFRDYAVPVEHPATTSSEATRVLGTFLRDIVRRNPETFRIFGPDETASNRLSNVFEVTDRQWGAEILDTDDHLAPQRPRHRGPQRAPLPGLPGGLPADRPARPVQLLRGVHPHRRLDVQPAREVAEGDARDPVAAADRVAQLPAHVARLAPGPQRLLAPGSRVHRPRGSTRRPRSCACTCRRTPTACCRSPTTACAAATTST